MQYLLSFLEGIITFISPCLLPMLPVYATYFLGDSEEGKKGKALKNSLGFVLGFTVVFVLLGAFAGTIGSYLTGHSALFNLITGAIVILFGLNYLGVFKLGFLNASKRIGFKPKNLGFFSAILFGMVFSIGWTPCVGAFLGSALMLASQQGTAISGIIMLLLYSAGLGIPFIISALLIEKLKGAFGFIKKHYKIVNRISGALLVVIGLLMATGYMSKLMLLMS